MVRVLNLKTDEEQFFTCSPKQAVISAYALEKNLSTQLATGKLRAPVMEGKYSYSCGDWATLKPVVSPYQIH